MGGGDNDDGSANRAAIPLTAGAIVTAQFTMAVATWAADALTEMGVGRKPLFMAGILSLPIRCALIIWWKDAGHAYLLSTQILDGVGGGLIGLIHPYLVADITFGTGRFNVVSKWKIGPIVSHSLSVLVQPKSNAIFLTDIHHCPLLSGFDRLLFWYGCYAVQLSWTDGCGTLWARG